MTTPKTYKPKKCEVCTKPLNNTKRGVKTCDAECEEIFQRGLKLKAGSRILKAARLTMKNKAYYEDLLQKEVNKLARLIDQVHPCISSGRTTGQRHGGHYFSRGSNATIRFHLMNIYSQCAEQNNNKSGNPVGYREGLISTFGIEHMEYVESLKGHPPIKLSVDEIKEKIRIARECVKEMEQTLGANGDKISTRSRLIYRTMYNTKLNIYQY